MNWTEHTRLAGAKCRRAYSSLHILRASLCTCVRIMHADTCAQRICRGCLCVYSKPSKPRSVNLHVVIPCWGEALQHDAILIEGWRTSARGWEGAGATWEMGTCSERCIVQLRSCCCCCCCCCCSRPAYDNIESLFEISNSLESQISLSRSPSTPASHPAADYHPLPDATRLFSFRIRRRT
jgi:hypothetical protein